MKIINIFLPSIPNMKLEKIKLKPTYLDNKKLTQIKNISQLLDLLNFCFLVMHLDGNDGIFVTSLMEINQKEF